jgi:hypothetical protein
VVPSTVQVRRIHEGGRAARRGIFLVVLAMICTFHLSACALGCIFVQTFRCGRATPAPAYSVTCLIDVPIVGAIGRRHSFTLASVGRMANC